MKKILLFVFILALSVAPSCQEKTTKEKYDTEYWDSVERENRYKETGRKDLAKQEAKYRQDRLRGKTKGKYTNKEGEDTRIYKDSKEQKKDLDAIDEYMKKNPDF